MLNQIIDYLKSSKQELRKVVWPSSEETVKKTILVVVISLLVAVYLGALDYLFTMLLEMVV